MNGSELVEELSRGLAELADASRKEPAEAMGVALLAVDEREARDALIAQRDKLAPVETPSLAAAMLSVVEGRRKASDWKRWLDAIDTGVLDQLRNGAELVEGLTQKLWREATSDEPLEGDGLQVAVDALSRIAAEVEAEGDQATELIRPAVGEVPMGEPSAQIQGGRLKLAMLFAGAGLIRREQIAPTALVAISEGLAQQLEPQEMNQPLSRHVERWGSRLAPYADDASRERLREATESSPWLPQPFRETLMIAGSLRDDGEQQSPYSDEQIVSVVSEHGAWFDEGLALWIGHFGPTAAAVGRAIAPLADEEPPEPVRLALAERFEKAESETRTELVAPALRRLLEAPPSDAFLAVVELEKADRAEIVELLAGLYASAGNNSQRETILEVAKSLGPLGDQERKRLITEIVIPMAHQGKEALDLVVKYFDLCLPPPRGTVTNLRKTLRERAKGGDQKRRVDQALLAAKLIKRSGLLGRGRKDVGED